MSATPPLLLLLTETENRQLQSTIFCMIYVIVGKPSLYCVLRDSAAAMQHLRYRTNTSTSSIRRPPPLSSYDVMQMHPLLMMCAPSLR